MIGGSQDNKETASWLMMPSPRIKLGQAEATPGRENNGDRGSKNKYGAEDSAALFFSRFLEEGPRTGLSTGYELG